MPEMPQMEHPVNSELFGVIELGFHCYVPCECKHPACKRCRDDADVVKGRAALAKLREEHRNALTWKPTAIQAAGEIAAKTAMAEEVDRLHLEAFASLTQDNERLSGEITESRKCAALRKDVADAADRECHAREKRIVALTKELDEARAEAACRDEELANTKRRLAEMVLERLHFMEAAAEAEFVSIADDAFRQVSQAVIMDAGNAKTAFEKWKVEKARVAHLEGALRDQKCFGCSWPIGYVVPTDPGYRDWSICTHCKAAREALGASIPYIWTTDSARPAALSFPVESRVYRCSICRTECDQWDALNAVWRCKCKTVSHPSAPTSSPVEPTLADLEADARRALKEYRRGVTVSLESLMDDPQPTDTPYSQGQQARRDGLEEGQCPYRPVSGSAAAWLAGLRQQEFASHLASPEAPLTQGERSAEDNYVDAGDPAYWRKEAERAGDLLVNMRVEVLTVIKQAICHANSAGYLAATGPATRGTVDRMSDEAMQIVRILSPVVARLSASPDTGTPDDRITDAAVAEIREILKDAPPFEKMLESTISAALSASPEPVVKQSLTTEIPEVAPEEPSAAPSDAEMLDWLERIGFSTVVNGRIEKHPGVHCWRETTPAGERWMWTAKWIGSEFTNVRSAIRAAMREGKA